MNLEFPTVWEENSPSSLVDIAIRFCARHMEILLSYSNFTMNHELRDGISLPREICDRIIYIINLELRNSTVDKSQEDKFHCLLKMFQNPLRTRLSHVNLSYLPILDKDLEIICRHCITELNISECFKLTHVAFSYLNRLESSLKSLIIGKSFRSFLENETEDEKVPEEYLLNVPNLRKLVLHSLSFPQFYCTFKNMKYLTHLDLSLCKELGCLEYLKDNKQLLSLVLYNIPDLLACIDVICTLTSLRHLDISQSNEHNVVFRNPNKVLKSLIESLPDLVSLDISGTNLAGHRVQEREEERLENVRNSSLSRVRSKDTKPEDKSVTDIVGLKSRVNRPLEFLGLYNTAYEACYRHHIPAKKITGDANEEQILTAGQTYCSRSEVIQKVLNDLFHIFRFSICNNIKLALDVVMEAMRLHIRKIHVQISGSASLFYIVKGEEKANFNVKIKKKIIKTVLDAMFAHIRDVTMIRNGCLTLIHFKIPEDVFFDYERVVKLLLIIVAQDDQDEFVQRIGVYLLNSIVCQVDGEHKKLVGDHSAISVMLQLISGRLSQQVCDEVMETAWSTMWNVTDETPVNCQRFLEKEGMSLFLRCLETFPEKPELLRNMMGLLGNVAEVKELRPHLMKNEYLSVFSELLSSESDGIEVSYNAAGILSHMASDGPDVWEEHNISVVTRKNILCGIVKAIEGWNLNAKRNINYRSFEPILRLLYVDFSPEAQYWAIWALANLTKVYPDKYCSLLREEGGLPIIEGQSKFHCYSHARELALMILDQCKDYEDKKMHEDM